MALLRSSSSNSSSLSQIRRKKSSRRRNPGCSSFVAGCLKCSVPGLLFVFVLLLVKEQQRLASSDDYYSALSSFLNIENATTTTTKSSNNNNNIRSIQNNVNTPWIRSWGCARNEAPFLFVHIGKAGGGQVRARIGAAAQNFTREKWWRLDDMSYYPIREDIPVKKEDKHSENENANNQSRSILHYGTMVMGKMNNMLPYVAGREIDNPFLRTFTLEGFLPCHGTNPLAHAMACHTDHDICQVPKERRAMGMNESQERCDTVYMGHNVLGSELGFLPTEYLVRWWKMLRRGNEADGDMVVTRLRSRHSRRQWLTDVISSNSDSSIDASSCAEGKLKFRSYRQNYASCIRHIVENANQVSQEALGDRYHSNSTAATTLNDDNNYGPLYSSLPVLRVTMIREPFSWLKSKFFWMSDHAGINLTMKTDHIVVADKSPQLNNKLRDKILSDPKKKSVTFVKCDDFEHFTTGWGRQSALEYIFYLCGIDCMGRWQEIQDSFVGDENVLRAKHSEFLRVMEAQASHNLRHSFAVVGILEETQSFYDMMTQRVQYMDTALNPEVWGRSHSSGKGPEQNRCASIFQDPSFQDKVAAACPEVATLLRLYKIGLQVNQLHKKELAKC